MPAICKNCRKKVGVPWRTMWFMVPFLVLYLLGQAGLAFVCFLLACYIHLKWIPLIRK